MKCPECAQTTRFTALDSTGNEITIDRFCRDRLGRELEPDPYGACRCESCGYEADAEDFEECDEYDPEVEADSEEEEMWMDDNPEWEEEDPGEDIYANLY